MGYRTVVLLVNDLAHMWSQDPELGRKIQVAATTSAAGAPLEGNYGMIGEQVHADAQTLLVADSYSVTPIAHSWWSRTETQEQMHVKLLTAMADKLGYRLVKKPIR